MRFAEPQPFSTINTTPLIDVMLVLLIMFIICLPATTHKVAVDLPSGPGRDTKPIVHKLAIDQAGRLSWDGAALREADLPARLGATQAAAGEHVLHLQTHPEARYERFNQTLSVIKKAGVTRLGFVGNQPLAN